MHLDGFSYSHIIRYVQGICEHFRNPLAWNILNSLHCDCKDFFFFFIILCSVSCHVVPIVIMLADVCVLLNAVHCT
jgi:hypothetical protein